MRSFWSSAGWAALFCAVVLSAASPVRAQGALADTLKKYKQAADKASLPKTVAKALVKPSADLLPDGTWIMLDIPDLGATRARAKDNAIYKILADPQVKEYLKPVSDKLDEWFKKTDLELQAKIKLSFDDLLKLANGRLAIALTGVSMMPPNPGPSAVLLLTPADPQHLSACVAKLLSALPPEDVKKIQTRMVQGMAVSQPEGNPPVSWAIAGNTLVIALGDKTIDGVLARMSDGGLPAEASAKEGPCLSTNATYMAVRDKMKDVNQDWMLYVSIEKPMQLLLALGGEKAAWADAHLNLQQFKALAAAGKLDGPGVDDAIYLHLPGEPGKAGALLTPKPVDMKLLQCVPADSQSFCVTRLNLPLAYDTVVGAIKELAPPQTYQEFLKGLDEAKLELGVGIEDEIVRPLGEELVFYQVPPALDEIKARLKDLPPEARASLQYEYGIGRFVLILSLKDATKMRQSLAALTDFVVANVKLSSADLKDIAITPETYQGVELRVLNGIPDTALRPTYAVTDKFLIVSGTPDLVKKALDQSEGRGKNITESAGWTEIKARIPDGAGAIMAQISGVGFEQNKLLIQEVTLPSMQAMMQIVFMSLGGDLGFGELLQKDPAPLLDAANRNSFIIVATVRTEPDGVMLRAHSATGASPTMIAVPVIATAVIMPALFRARAEARGRNNFEQVGHAMEANCRNNLKQIGIAIEAYKNLNNNQMPETLMDLMPRYMDNPNVFLCPSARQAGYEYVGPIPKDKVGPNTMIARDTLTNHPDGCNCLYYDGHVSFVPRERLEAELKRCLDALKPWLDAQPEGAQMRVKLFYEAAE